LPGSSKLYFMISKRRFLILLAPLIFMVSFQSFGQGYRIAVSFKGLSSDTVILGEYFTTRMIPKDTLVLDRSGKGVFEGSEAFTGGLYLVYLDPMHYFDFLLGDDQDLSITADTARLPEGIRFEGSQDNDIFQEYKGFLQLKREELNQQQQLLSRASGKEDTAAVREQQKQINLEMEQYMDDIEKDYGDLFVSEFISATREPVPPESLLTGEARHDDSVRFFYFRNHYFDRFNPFNVRLLHTPIYEGKIQNYIGRVVPQHPDSLIVAVDYLLQGSKVNPDLYRYMLITLFNHFAESNYMGMDAVYFHIAEYYYIPDAGWSSPEFIAKLKDNLEKNKPTLIGQTAPDLILREIPPEHFQMAAQDTAIKRDPYIGKDFHLYGIDAPYTILYFWEGDCSHCKKATPILYDVYSRLKDKGVKVVSVHAINTIEGKELWVDFVNSHEMYDWINCWSPYSNEFRKAYNLQSYPQLFILDRDKKIVAKRVTPEQAEQIIDNLIANDSKVNP
jgi:thiol-disulfide isomerase/thioredoxin